MFSPKYYHIEERNQLAMFHERTQTTVTRQTLEHMGMFSLEFNSLIL